MEQTGIVRVLELLMFLANNHYTTKEEICERFGFTERTFFRLIKTYRDAGFVVKRNEHNVYRLESSKDKRHKKLEDLLHFSEEEAMILHNAIDAVEPDTKSRELLKKKLYAVYDSKIIANLSMEQKTIQITNALMEAIKNKKQVLIKDYRSGHSNTMSDRLVEPYEFTDAIDQVWCYELETSQVKIFKISRIGRVEILDQLWMHDAEHKTGYVDIFHMSSTRQIPIRLRLSMKAANLLIEEYPLATRYLKKLEDSRYILETSVCGLEGVTRFVLGLYDDVEVLEGDELRDYLRYKINKMGSRI